MPTEQHSAAQLTSLAYLTTDFPRKFHDRNPRPDRVCLLTRARAYIYTHPLSRFLSPTLPPTLPPSLARPLSPPNSPPALSLSLSAEIPSLRNYENGQTRNEHRQ
jgi:hypothetical protein